MLMVGAKVLFNSAKMLKMGVLVVFMHKQRFLFVQGEKFGYPAVPSD